MATSCPLPPILLLTVTTTRTSLGSAQGVGIHMVGKEPLLLLPWYHGSFNEIKGTVSQNTTVIFEGAFYLG
jgi:hypothetical protein